MIVKVCLLYLIYIVNFIQWNVQCSNLVQIDKLHLITPKINQHLNQLNQLNQRSKLNFDQFNELQPSINSINYKPNDDRSDQVASIQYELKIVQQKPIPSSTFNIQQSNTSPSVAVDQNEDTNKMFDNKNDQKNEQRSEFRSSGPRKGFRNEENSPRNNPRNEEDGPRNDENNLRSLRNDENNSDNKLSTQQSKINRSASILQHYSNPIGIASKAKQLENHSYMIHHGSHPHSPSHPGFAHSTNHDSHEQHTPTEIKKIVHIHHYHHEHLGNDGFSKKHEKEKEKLTEKLVEKQVQEQVLKNFEEELEREQENEMLKKKKKKKKKGFSKKASTFDDNEGWKPVKYSDLMKGKRKAVMQVMDDDDQDDYKAYSHNHKSKLPRKKSKDHHFKSSKTELKYAKESDDEPEESSRDDEERYSKNSKKKNLHKERASDNEDADEEAFVSKPLTKDEEAYHQSQLENENDYSFENDEHYVPSKNDNHINRHSSSERLKDEESKEVKKLNKKILRNEKKEIKMYNDRPTNEKSSQEKLLSEQSTDKPEIIMDLIRKNQRLRKINERIHEAGKQMNKKHDEQPLIEFLNTNVSKRTNMQLRRNWLGLELITKNN